MRSAKRIMVCGIALVLAAVASIGFSGYGIAAAPKVVVLQAASGGLGGTWYGQMAALAAIVKEADPGIDMKTVPGAGLANPLRVDSGDAQVAWGMPTFVKDAVEGKGEFNTPSKNVRGIAAGFTLHPLQFLVTRDSGIKSIEEIKQKRLPIRIAIGRAGSVDEITARMILEYYGITYDTVKSWGGSVMLLEYSEQVKKIKDRQADAYILMMPIPAPTVQEIILNRPLKMLPLDPKMAEEFNRKYAFAVQKLTPDMYDGKTLDEAMIVPAVDLSLIVNNKVSDDVVYRITKAICENVDKVRAIGPTFVDFDPAESWKNTGAPLHPGAEKYYREMGYIK